mmetsp:Transcript_1590/g.5614  ORF Transcript_1590/g.5614 Transcript_1590/m.5614 type:complete len:225 (+) Transcript_1590:303-977(+)
MRRGRQLPLPPRQAALRPHSACRRSPPATWACAECTTRAGRRSLPGTWTACWRSTSSRPPSAAHSTARSSWRLTPRPDASSQWKATTRLASRCSCGLRACRGAFPRKASWGCSLAGCQWKVRRQRQWSRHWRSATRSCWTSSSTTTTARRGRTGLQTAGGGWWCSIAAWHGGTALLVLLAAWRRCCATPGPCGRTKRRASMCGRSTALWSPCTWRSTASSSRGR